MCLNLNPKFPSQTVVVAIGCTLLRSMLADEGAPFLFCLVSRGFDLVPCQMARFWPARSGGISGATLVVSNDPREKWWSRACSSLRHRV